LGESGAPIISLCFPYAFSPLIPMPSYELWLIAVLLYSVLKLLETKGIDCC
jgi:hypothetical protein